MEIIIGLIIIAIGSFGQSSSYVPINKVKDWSWESFWLVQGIFAWLVFPFLGAQLAIPNGSSLLELWSAGGAAGAVIYGILWGIGGLTFGLSMRYLGVALGRVSRLERVPVSGRFSRQFLAERICSMAMAWSC